MSHRIKPALVGTAVGLLIGLILGGAAWAINSDDHRLVGIESLSHYAGQTALGLATAGFIVGWIGRVPELIGFAFGAVGMVFTTIVCESIRGRWVVLWLIGACVVIGVIGGLLVGLTMRVLGYAKRLTN